jgi:hypothetical protein
MKEDIYDSHLLLIPGYQYLKQRKLRAVKGGICGLSECKKFVFGSILHKTVREMNTLGSFLLPLSALEGISKYLIVKI